MILFRRLCHGYTHTGKEWYEKVHGLKNFSSWSFTLSKINFRGLGTKPYQAQRFFFLAYQEMHRDPKGCILDAKWPHVGAPRAYRQAIQLWPSCF